MKDKNLDPLSTRIEPREISLLTSEEERKQTYQKWTEEDHSKLVLLCERYQIKESASMFYQLALALAREHVKGFKTKRVHKKKWTIRNGSILVVEIERLAPSNDPNRDITQAAGQLAQKEPWLTFLKNDKKEDGFVNPEPGEPLRIAYYNFNKSRWAETYRKAFLWHVHQNTIDEWNEEIKDILEDL